MEEELILKQPSDRRLGDNNSLPLGPPGAEFDAVEFDEKNAALKPPVREKENSASERSSRRRSPSGSPPPRKRKSPSRSSRRSPSPPARVRGRRSPSPRRNRYRDYSPDRRPRYGGRRSPDRRRSPPRRGGGRGRYRGRGRSSSRSISRSPSPPRRGGGASSSRWSPKKKPNTPPPQPPPTNLSRQLSQPPPTSNQPPPQYGVMAPPPPQLYGEAYGPPPGYNQYGVPPPQTGFVQPNDAYASMQPQGPGFNTTYPPPGAWGVDAYGQQQWMPPPTQMQQMPPPPQQQQPPPLVVQPTSQPQVATNIPPPTAATSASGNKHMNILSDEAPGTLDPQHDAVAQEAENQRDELKKQRTSYLKKTSVLKKELKMLKDQRKDLHSGGAPASPTTKGFIDENEKLQNQIQKKLSTIENVIDMLTGIIGEENLDKDEEQLDDDDVLKEAALSSLQKSHGEHGGVLANQNTNTLSTSHKKKLRSSSSSSDSSSGSSSSSSSDSSSSSETEQAATKQDEEDDSSPERLKKKVIESMKNKDKDLARTKQEQKGPNKKERFNYVFYDPEMHWCQTCNVFPKTAKDYLNHLHTKIHMDRESIETPWHTDMVTDQFPTYENAPTKRTPIRGLTFFVPATAWFCKLCNIWMGDLHCASTHLKSQLHANRYNGFLEENPHYEVNWLADRQIVLNEQKSTPLPQQITSVSTTAADRKKSNKKDEDKTNKKRKKKSDKKQKKKKKKGNKKRKKSSDSSSSSSSDSSSSTDSDEPKKKRISNIEIKDLDNPNPAVSIRLSMRKQENIKNDDDIAPPPPQLKLKPPSPTTPQPPASGKWLVVQEGLRNRDGDRDTDDSIIQQWNTVQPVISESEKKLLEQLKGKLKNKSKDEQQPKSSTSQKADNEKENRDRDRERGSEGRNERSDRRDRDGGNRVRDERDRRTSRRSRTRSPTRSRSRGRDYRRNVRRSLSRNRGRMSPRSWRNRNRRNDRSRSRSLRKRSRSPYDRRRRSSRSRSRSGSRGISRVEKPVVRPAEFRPRVPEKDKEKEKKSVENKDKKEKAKPKSTSSSTTNAANSAGKKLPFIGKMPVFKKQATGAPGEMGEKRPEDLQVQQAQQPGTFIYTMDATNAFTRPPAPTAAQIQMAMMEDAYGNAPPFHPDAGMMVDYDDLMPDPVQFVNIMGQAPPPPPPQVTEDDKDMLPPGIDVEESEEFVPKPITEGPPPGKGPLPKDLEDALNIIFPGEKRPGDESDNEEGGELGKKKAKGETQIINDEPLMQPEELAKDGIHLVTFEETSQLGLDEASQMSMNEPLVFNRPPSDSTTTAIITTADMEIEDANSEHNLDVKIDKVPTPPAEIDEQTSAANIEMPAEEKVISPPSPQIIKEQEIGIPIPSENDKPLEVKETSQDEKSISQNGTELMHPNIEIDLADIPQPPPSPTESEKNRRQEELNDLAMLGIDADDMAAQCM